MKAAKTILGIVLGVCLIALLPELLAVIFAWIWQLLFFLVPVVFVGGVIYAIIRLRENAEIERKDREAERKPWHEPTDR